MSDVIDIDVLKKEFAEKTKSKELKEFANSQQLLLERLVTENKALVSKVRHLEEMLKALPTPRLQTDTQDGEVICMEQLSILRNKSANRELTLEETKKLDILVKSLKLLKEESSVPAQYLDLSNAEEAELVAIAQQSGPKG